MGLSQHSNSVVVLFHFISRDSKSCDAVRYLCRNFTDVTISVIGARKIQINFEM